MLVLTRKQQERISIGHNITITVVRIKGNKVRIGIDAPKEVRVVRDELPRHEDVLEQQESSAIAAPKTPETPAIPATVLDNSEPGDRLQPGRKMRGEGLRVVLKRVEQRRRSGDSLRRAATLAVLAALE